MLCFIGKIDGLTKLLRFDILWEMHPNITKNTYKKTTYALKTPRVIALPFMYGVEYIFISN